MSHRYQGRSIIRNNQTTWEKDDVVSLYEKDSELQRPEQTILDELAPQMLKMDMLDIGIGAGRTTAHFANAVQSYVGIDYSAPMVDSCRRRFGNRLANASFEVGDATAMRNFEANRFDFILFSFNGIDYVDQEGRLKVFREVFRVGREGALFCFSSHNLLGIERLNPLRRHLFFTLNPIWVIRPIVSWLRWMVRYRPRQSVQALRSAPYAVVNDGTYDNGLDTYYIQPREQLAQLKEWFTDTRVFGLESGSELDIHSELDHATDPWLYYLCRIRPKPA